MEVEVTATLVATVAAAAVLIGMSKGGLRGLGTLATIMVALVVPASVAIGLMLPFMIIADMAAVVALRHQIDRAVVQPLVAGSVVGVTVASVLLKSMSAEVLELVMAAVIVVFAMQRFARLIADNGEPSTRSFLATTPAGMGAGLLAGITSTVAHVGGPPVSMHLLARQIPPLAFAGNAVAVFLFINWLKIPAYIGAGVLDWSLMASLAPTGLLVVPGVLAGRWITARLRPKSFETFILAGLVVGAALLIFR